MKLSPNDVDLFYKLMWPLQFYVNRKLDIFPNVDSIDEYADDLAYEDKLPVRNALYEHVEYIDSFVDENPAELTQDELAIVKSWKNFVAGDFYIERFLKAGAILINSTDPPKVYLVWGLINSLEEVLGYYNRPPIMTKMVLLPFKDRIIFDGLVQTYSIFFGGGIKGSLKETYMAAKQNRSIIQTLDPLLQAQQQEKAQRKPTRDWRPEIDELVKAANRLKGGGVPIQSEAFRLLKAATLLAQAVVHNPDDLVALCKLDNRVDKALLQLEKALNRAEM